MKRQRLQVRVPSAAVPVLCRLPWPEASGDFSLDRPPNPHLGLGRSRRYQTPKQSVEAPPELAVSTLCQWGVGSQPGRLSESLCGCRVDSRLLSLSFARRSLSPPSSWVRFDTAWRRSTWPCAGRPHARRSSRMPSRALVSDSSPFHRWCARRQIDADEGRLTRFPASLPLGGSAERSAHSANQGICLCCSQQACNAVEGCWRFLPHEDQTHNFGIGGAHGSNQDHEGLRQDLGMTCTLDSMFSSSLRQSRTTTVEYESICFIKLFCHGFGC